MQRERALSTPSTPFHPSRERSDRESRLEPPSLPSPDFRSQSALSHGNLCMSEQRQPTTSSTPASRRRMVWFHSGVTGMALPRYCATKCLASRALTTCNSCARSTQFVMSGKRRVARRACRRRTASRGRNVREPSKQGTRSFPSRGVYSL